MSEKMAEQKIPIDQWQWYGSPGHLIVSRWCRFHLLTEVGDWIISTVGEYVHPRHSGGSEKVENDWLEENWPGEEIGPGRRYETMVFRFKNKHRCECGCGRPIPDSWDDVYMQGANDAKSARANHYALCEKYAGMAET